jgi:hypothetical protein
VVDNRRISETEIVVVVPSNRLWRSANVGRFDVEKVEHRSERLLSELSQSHCVGRSARVRSGSRECHRLVEDVVVRVRLAVRSLQEVVERPDGVVVAPGVCVVMRVEDASVDEDTRP